MYQALYRTWRPQVFEDVVGQYPIIKTLQHEVENGHLAHAYLFTGSRGTGKTTCARILAKAVNCLSPQSGDPCGKCVNCLSIAEGSMTDILELDAASNNSVEDVRALREEAIFPPTTGKYRVYIIDEAHMLSKNAFNALLKIMEEPPAWVLFILATTEVQKVPATILSRVQRFDFRRVDAVALGAYLEKIAQAEHIELDKDAAQLIGRISDGGVRDAISLLDQCATVDGKVDMGRVREIAGLADGAQVTAMVDAIIAGDTGGILEQITQIHAKSVDFRPFTEALLAYFRNLMILCSVKKPGDLLRVSSEELAVLKKQAEKLALPYIFFAIDVLQSLYIRIGSDRSALALFEMSMLKLCRPEYAEDTEALSARIAKLERGGIVISKSSTKVKETAPLSEVPWDIPPPLEEDFPSAEIPPIEETVETVTVSEHEEKPPVSPPPEYGEPSPILSPPETGSEILEVEGELSQWTEIVALLAKKNPPLYATLENSKAFFKGDLLLIDAENPVFFDLMRGSGKTKESLRTAIFEIAGKTYRLGPLKKGTQVEEKPTGLDAIRQAAAEKGLPITEK